MDLENIRKENKKMLLDNLFYDLEYSYYMIPQGYEIKIYEEKKIKTLINNIINGLIDIRFIVYYYLGQRYLVGNVDDIFNLYCYNKDIKISGKKTVWKGLNHLYLEKNIKRSHQRENDDHVNYNFLKEKIKVSKFMVEIISYSSPSKKEWLNLYEKINGEFDMKINSMEKWLFPEEYSNIKYLYKYIPENYTKKYNFFKILATCYDLDKNNSLITQFKYLLPQLEEDLSNFNQLKEKELKRKEFIEKFKSFKKGEVNESK